MYQIRPEFFGMQIDYACLMVLICVALPASAAGKRKGKENAENCYSKKNLANDNLICGEQKIFR